jgi:hypothetical protein
VVHAKPPTWKRYRNAPTGLSFEYPAGLQMRERDPRRVGLPAADAIVDLLDANGTLWLQFVVNHGSASSNANTIFTIPPHFDRSCKPLRLAGAEAFVCISHGRAAAHWGVQILAPRDCSIQSPFDNPPLRDRFVPMLSIIRTVRFTGGVGLVRSHVEVPGWPTTVKLVVPPSSGSTSAAEIFVSNYNSDIHNPFYGNSITAYPLNGAGNVSPTAVIADWPRTGLDYARGIALDSRGYIYVANQATFTGGFSVRVYPPGRNGNFAPSATISGEPTKRKYPLIVPTGIALDSHDNIYVTNDGGTVQGMSQSFAEKFGYSGSVTIFGARSHGKVKPDAWITGPNTGLRDPYGIAVDAQGSVYVANFEGGASGSGNVTIYPAGSNGDVKPSATIAGNATLMRQPYGLALDSSGSILVANYFGGPAGTRSITVYRSGSKGDVAPIRTITGPNTKLDYPWGIATRPYQCSSAGR